MENEEILRHVDHTLLRQTATWEEIKALCDEGIKYGVASVCIPPSRVRRAKEYVGDSLKICTVIGFPQRLRHDGNQALRGGGRDRKRRG